MASLIAHQASLRREADAILDGGLRALLDEFGQVHVSGSYSLGLLTWRDLDIYLDFDTENLLRFFELGARLAKLLKTGKMSFIDNRLKWSPQNPLGLYWGIRPGDASTGWKFDIWAMPPEECACQLRTCQSIAARLDDELREKILAIKADVCKHPRHRKDVYSIDVYAAVLDAGVVDTAGFWEYLKTIRE